MTTYSKLVLSGAAAGNKQIAITGTDVGSSVLIHTAHATALDELTLFVASVNTTAVVLTILFGGTATSDKIIMSIAPQQGHVRIVAGAILTNSLLVKAYADSANLLNITGYVNRIQ